MSGVGAPDLDLLDAAHLTEGVEVGAGHAAGPDHPYHAAVISRQIFGPEPGAAADPHVLEEAVIDHRDRRCIFGAEQEEKTQECAWRARVFVLAQAAVLARLCHHIGEHAGANETILLAAASHHSPAGVRCSLFTRWHVNIN